jgi:hypothetical protein
MSQPTDETSSSAYDSDESSSVSTDNPLRGEDRIIRATTAQRRLDESESQEKAKDKELRKTREKLREMGLDEKGKVPAHGGDDVEAKLPGTDPWVGTFIWRYCTTDEGQSLAVASVVAGAAVLTAAGTLASQVSGILSAASAADAAEDRIAAGNAPGTNSSSATEQMNEELNASSQRSLFAAGPLPIGAAIGAMVALINLLEKYRSTRLAILGRIKELAEKYEEDSAELAELRTRTAALRQELTTLGVLP